MASFDVVAAFRAQAGHCRDLDPFTAALCTALAELLPALGTPLAGAVLGWPGRPMADAPPPLAGGLHHLALSDADPAAVALTASSRPIRTGWRRRCRRCCGAGTAGSPPGSRPPQTNEVARSALLLPALLLARRTGLPLALWGSAPAPASTCSPTPMATATARPAGAARPVRLPRAARRGNRRPPRVAARRGCDRAPVDLASETARGCSPTWADQRERLERCRAPSAWRSPTASPSSAPMPPTSSPRRWPAGARRIP
ncbi:MAG: DUF2332 family protein [Dongiaceae bacterium]